LRIHIELDSDEVELKAVANALRALSRGQKEPPEPQKEGSFAQVERSDQPTADLPKPIGFHLPYEE
jgi:hypothetical protein